MTTASAELGVVFARSAEGHTMQPVSFEEVQCPVTKTRERRRMLQTGLDCSSPGPAHRARDPPACRAALMGPRGEPSPLGWVPKRGRSRALVPANVVAEFALPF